MSAIFNFFSESVLSFKGLSGSSNWPGYISSVLIRPVLFVVMYGLLGRFASNSEAAQIYIIGMTAFSIPPPTIQGILGSFSTDRQIGTLSVLFSSPANRLLTYLARGLAHWPNAMITFTLCLLFAWQFLNLDISDTNWTLLVCAALSICFSGMAVGLLVGNLAITTGDWAPGIVLANGLLLTLTGVIIPRNDLPAPLVDVGLFLPVTRGLESFRDSLVGGSVGANWEQLAGELLVGLVYLIAGFLIFRAVEIMARQRGNLDAPLA